MSRDLGQTYAQSLALVRYLVKKAQIDGGRVFGIEGEVHALSVPDGPEGGRPSWQYSHPVTSWTQDWRASGVANLAVKAAMAPTAVR